MTLFLHLARRALLAFLGALVAVVVLFVAVEFAESASLFQGEGALRAALQVYLYRAAAVAWQTAPAAMLLAASLTATGIRRTREYDAMRALGLGPVAGGRCRCWWWPRWWPAAWWSSTTWSRPARPRGPTRSRPRAGRATDAWSRWQERKTWFRGRDGRRIYELRAAGPDGSFERVTVLELGPDFRLSRRLDAARMLPGPDGDLDPRGGRGAALPPRRAR